MDEKREYDSFFVEQNIDRAVKVTTIIVFVLIAPVIFVNSVILLRLKRETDICKSKCLPPNPWNTLLRQLQRGYNGHRCWSEAL